MTPPSIKGQRAVNTFLTSCGLALPSGCLGGCWGIVFAALLGACTSDHAPDDMARQNTRSVLLIENADIHEASGLAVSRRDPARLWLHNDSGESARVFIIDTSGRGRHSVDINGARNIDWEDLDAYSMDGKPRLLIADVGDNRAARPTVQLYVIDEPAADADSTSASMIDLAYPDGPRDVEAVAVDAEARQAYLLTKRDDPPRLYRVSLEPATVAPTVAEFLGTVTSIPPPTEEDLSADPKYGRFRAQPTAMSVSADGSRIVVTTYKDSYLYRRTGGERWVDALNRTPELIDVPQFRQTEAAGISADGRTLFIASEQLPAPMARIELAD